MTADGSSSAQWTVPGYAEIRELGRGGFGRVVLARHEASRTYVAIKYLDAAAPAAFRAEARMLHTVRDPHVTRLYELVEGPQGAAIVMEAVDGVSLRDLLREQGPPGPVAALAMLKGSLRGLAAAHAAGVVHRDYKPANVLVQRDGVSRLVDFGIAAFAGEPGATAGTPAYMAPEQWEGGPAAPATDVYAATCVFFECVTGERPFSGDTAEELRIRHARAPVPVERVPEPLRDLVTRGMSKDPMVRPASAATFADELETTARAAYGARWERAGLRRLGEAAAGLAALAPIAVLAGAKGGLASGVTGTGQSLAAKIVTSKVALAVGGAAVAGSTVTAGVVAATPEHHAHRPAGHTASPTRPLALGRFTVAAPLSWAARRPPFDNGDPESYIVTTPGHCTGRTPPRCPSVDVYGRATITAIHAPFSPYKLTESFAGMHMQDEGYDCPPQPTLRAGNSDGGIGGGARLTAGSTAQVGSRTAYYREWAIPCWTRNRAEWGQPVAPTNVSFVERIWYLPDSKVLIVDDWRTPGLADILIKATWK